MIVMTIRLTTRITLAWSLIVLTSYQISPETKKRVESEKMMHGASVLCVNHLQDIGIVDRWSRDMGREVECRFLYHVLGFYAQMYPNESRLGNSTRDSRAIP